MYESIRLANYKKIGGMGLQGFLEIYSKKLTSFACQIFMAITIIMSYYVS